MDKKAQVEQLTNNIDNFEPIAKIVIIGVGGAGSNAVNRMIDEKISCVQFYVANTDKQALMSSKAEKRKLIGLSTATTCIWRCRIFEKTKYWKVEDHSNRRTGTDRNEYYCL